MAQTDLLLPLVSGAQTMSCSAIACAAIRAAHQGAWLRALSLLDGRWDLLDRLADRRRRCRAACASAALAASLKAKIGPSSWDEPSPTSGRGHLAELQDLAASLARGSNGGAGHPRPASRRCGLARYACWSGRPLTRGSSDRTEGPGAARSGCLNCSDCTPICWPSCENTTVAAVGTTAGLLGWELLVLLTGLLVYILPPPSSSVAIVMVGVCWSGEAAWTAVEMVLGLLLGLLLARYCARRICRCRRALGAPLVVIVSGHSGDRHRPATGRLAGLWHGIQGGDGCTGDLLLVASALYDGSAGLAGLISPHHGGEPRAANQGSRAAALPASGAPHRCGGASDRRRDRRIGGASAGLGD